MLSLSAHYKCSVYQLKDAQGTRTTRTYTRVSTQTDTQAHSALDERERQREWKTKGERECEMEEESVVRVCVRVRAFACVCVHVGSRSSSREGGEREDKWGGEDMMRFLLEALGDIRRMGEHKEKERKKETRPD